MAAPERGAGEDTRAHDGTEGARARNAPRDGAAVHVASGRRWRPARVAVLALLVGLAVTVALSLASLAVYNNNEDRLLRLRARAVGLVLTGALPAIQIPLASAAELADATGGEAAKFRSFIAPYVGPGRQFLSVSLWRVGGTQRAPVVVVGAPPALASMPVAARAFFARAERTSVLSIIGLFAAAPPRLGYEFNTPGVRGGYAAYAESGLPADRRSRLESSSGFADLNYAVYLGRRVVPSQLLVTNISQLPVSGRQAREVVAFGDLGLTVVITPRGSLGGAFFQQLPWAIGVVGLLMSLAAAVMTGRLARRRLQAEQLAGDLDRIARENRALYTEQRSIAQTLQHALLPESLPDLPGLQTAARYVPAASGIDVGGDWYDVVAIDQQRVLLVVGDVSGHGLRAATTMASLRHAALAYAAHDHRPSSVLDRLSDFVNGQSHAYFATVLCALIEVDAHRVTVASAGHLSPLLIAGTQADFVALAVGVPIGVARDVPYTEVTTSVAPHSTLVAYSDGLVERRGEVLDVGLARLREIAAGDRCSLPDLLARLATELASDDHSDDTAIVAVRWQV